MKTTISINPPPSDGKCEHCGKHISELRAFGGKGDPLVGDFTGAKLLKTFRGMAPIVRDKEFVLLSKEYEDNKKDWKTFEKELIKIVGTKRAEQLIMHDQVANTIGASWECRDCIILDDIEYFKR